MWTFRNVFLITATIKILYLTWRCSFWRATVLTELGAWLGVVYGFILHQTWPITVHILFKTALNTIHFLTSLVSSLCQVCHQTDINFLTSIIAMIKSGQTGKLLKLTDLWWETARSTGLVSSNQRKHTYNKKESVYDILTYTTGVRQRQRNK
jgi:hypothetical protein